MGRGILGIEECNAEDNRATTPLSDGERASAGRFGRKIYFGVGEAGCAKIPPKMTWMGEAHLANKVSHPRGGDLSPAEDYRARIRPTRSSPACQAVGEGEIVADTGAISVQDQERDAPNPFGFCHFERNAELLQKRRHAR